MSNFLPIILGSDLNTYTIAREIHEAYGIKSVVATSRILLPCIHSKIIDFYKRDNFSKDDEIFVGLLNEIYGKNKNKYYDFILFAPDDVMRSLIFRNLDKLDFNPKLPYADRDVIAKLKTKSDFYEGIKDLDLAPQTLIASKDNYKSLSYPADVFIKADNDVFYKTLNFEGWQKGYHSTSIDQTIEILETIFNNGYDDKIIVQEFVKGGDGTEYSVDGYRTKEGISMSICRNILLDKRVEWIGNFVAKVDSKEEIIYEYATKIVETLGVYGLFNIDFKKNIETGKIYAFEINLRQGRCHYFATQNGINLSKIAIEDLVNDNFSEKRGDIPFTYYNLNLDETIANLEGELKEEFLAPQRRDNTQNPLVYDKDWGFRRRLKIEPYLKRLSDETFAVKEV